MVKEATKTGYSIAEPGDSINLAFPNSETRRGRVGKGCAHTLQAGDPEQVVVEPVICAMRGRNPDNPSDRTRGIPLEQRLEIGGGVSNTLTSVQKDNLVAEPIGGNNEEKNSREILCVLRQENGEESFCEWAIGGLYCILAEEILRHNVYAQGFLEKWGNKTTLFKCAHDGSSYEQIDFTAEAVRDLWGKWTLVCASQGRKLSKQQYRQFNGIVQKLPLEATSRKAFLQDLRQACEGFGLLQQALYTIQEIWESPHGGEMQWQYRIRKLTPRETFRLMDFDDEDFDKAKAAGVSDSQLYKQAGNSIVVAVLEAIFREML